MAEAALDAAPSKSLAVPSKAAVPVPEALTKAIPVVPDALSKALPVPDALSKAPPVPDALSKAAPPVPEALFKAPPEVPSKAAPPAVPSKSAGPPMAPPALPALPAMPALPVPEDSGKPKSLVLGDETFVFAAGLQEAYQDMDFTACSVLSTQNITAKDANPFPPVMKGRVRHMVNPVTIGKTFPPGSFDELVFFLPGLSFSVPKELGTSDRPLFAYRVHHFVFHLLRSSKLLLKGEGQLHVVWPEETCLMSSPCGAAGIELVQLLNHLGCKQSPAKYSMEPIKAECIKPMVFGGFCTELPEWLQNLQMLSFSLDMKPIPVPLSVALQLNPELELVSIKGAANVAGVESPPENALLKAKLIHEAIARKARLKELYGPRNPQETVSNYDLVKEALAPDPDALLSIPMEAFMMTLDELPHFSNCLKYQDQPTISHAQLDVLDPRLPTRVARPAPPAPAMPPPLPPPLPGPKKRSRPKEEEWGEMKFYCPLTKICTLTPEKMREHMEGELYKQFAAKDSTWESSEERRDMLFDLEEAEEAKRPKKSEKGEKGDRGKGGKSKGKGKRDGKDKGGKDRGKSGGKKGGKDRDRGKNRW